MTTFINTIDAKASFSEILSQVTQHQERIIITRRGKEIAAIITIEELNRLEALQDKSDLKESIEALKEARSTGTLSIDELKTQIG